MNALKIPESLESKYHGSGYVLAAVSEDGSTLINFAYCRDIDSAFDDGLEPNAAVAYIGDRQRFKEHGRFFEEPGHVRFAFGMMSCWEFVEL